MKFTIGPAITQQRRLTLLRRYLADEHESVPVRVAACLLLLYAQPLSRILRLTHRDLIEDDGELFIRLGDPPSPVPDPLAQLLRQLAPTGPEDAWLFPGKNPGQPLTHRSLFLKLRRLGFPLGEARVSALRQLVLQAPAPVVAAALGVHHTTTTRQAVNAGTSWSRYAAGNHDPGPPAPPARDDPDAMARLRATFVDGLDGWIDDQIAVIRPWGFDIGTIAVPVALWHGQQDTRVPYAHGEWLAGHIPDARFHPHQGGHRASEAVQQDMLA